MAERYATWNRIALEDRLAALRAEEIEIREALHRMTLAGAVLNIATETVSPVAAQPPLGNVVEIFEAHKRVREAEVKRRIAVDGQGAGADTDWQVPDGPRETDEKPELSGTWGGYGVTRPSGRSK